MTSRRALVVWAMLAAAVLASVGTMLAAPPRASAAVGECPPGYEPVGPGGGEFFDQNVAVFAGGSFSVIQTAAEAEGVVVALGDASFERSSAGTYNVGVAGVGSGVWPNPGTDMLIVGGDLSGNAITTVDVGHEIGGNVVVGGTIVPGIVLETSGGTISSNVTGATASYADLPAQIQAKSAEIAGLADTGVVAVTPFSMTFTGDGTSTTQVFSVSGATLLASSPTRSLQFLDIPDGAAVYINVTGTLAELQFNALLTEGGAVMDPNTDPAFPEIATHTLWNFPQATSVLLGGSAQLPGSILVPDTGSVVTNASPGTNGRIYVNGNLVHSGLSTEMHNYPFLPDEELDCLALIGGLTVEKVLVGPPGVVDPALEYTGTFSCTLDGTDVTPTDNTWSTTAGAGPTVVVASIQVGAMCTLTETPPTAPDGNHAWDPAVITPDTVTITDATTSVGFTVTNTLAELPGGFTVAKTVNDPDGLVDPTTEYAGTYTCVDVNDIEVATGNWSTTTGADPVVVTDQVPLGSVCTLTETPPTAPDGNHAWDPAVITPDTVTITDANTSVGFTVTNTLAELPGGFTVDKVLNDPDAVVDPTATYTGTFSCTLDGTEVATGNWSTTAGAGPVVVTDQVPLGSVCTLTETPPTAPDGNHAWDPAVITPDTVTITGPNTAVGFTVTNTLGAVLSTETTVTSTGGEPTSTMPNGAVDAGELPATGAPSGLVGLVGLGILGTVGGVTLARSARRRRPHDPAV